MPTLVIDDRQVTVAAGTSLLEAAMELGLVVPHYCYHKALGALGACRVCAVEILAGPEQGLRMACLVPAQDGMVVSTAAPRATGMRRAVTEWLMQNHPHDCPVCDEGGECQLQDMTVAGGHSVRRFQGKKRTFHNQDLGPFIEHEMNRCIQCYRCVRTYREHCGGDDFGVLGSRQRVWFGRFQPGRLESPFSGNLVDVCPTGVFTDRTARFKARVWEMEQAPSICPHCALGCATWPWARYREFVRITARENPETNGFFLCDRGRFGGGGVNHPERPRAPRVDGRERAWPEALGLVRERLGGLVRERGPGVVACLGSARASLEASWLLGRLAEMLGTDRVAHEVHPRRDAAARALAAGLGGLARSQRDIRQSDLVVLCGLDPHAEAPMLALAARQAVRQGARAVCIDPRGPRLPFPAGRIAAWPLPWLRALAARGDEGPTGVRAAALAGLADLRAALAAAASPVLLGGADLLGPEGVRALLALARALSRPERPCGAAVALSGPDSFGGGLLAGEPAGEPAGLDALLEGIEAGDVRALVCLESDPLAEHPEPARVEAALARLELLVCLDCAPGRTLARAHAFLPTTVPVEMAGAFVNFEGRLQAFERVFSPGLPIRATGGGDHPPREFRPDTPGDLPRPAWAVLAELQDMPPVLASIRAALAAEDARFASLPALEAGQPGVRLPLEEGAPGTEAAGADSPESGLRLLVTEALFGSEPLSALAEPIQRVALEATPDELGLHPDDAREAGLQVGQPARLECALGQVSLPWRPRPEFARGLVLAARRRGGALEAFVPGLGPIACRLGPAGEGVP
jgi:NADH-quinone oxidoreductase subunit G